MTMKKKKKKNSEGEEWEGGRGGVARNHAQYVSMGIWKSSQRSKVSSKLWDCSQMVHSWRERISFCMYNFEKVTRRADRHERTWEPSRGRRSEEKIRQRRGRARLFRCPDILLTPKVPGDTATLCVRQRVHIDVAVYLQTRIQYLSVMHEEEKVQRALSE